ncbi:MAG TPA: hypothetical protein VLM18_06085 [Croceibacterium sp.]|nr:hypothetical protein [Croceibacterium sp.]
MWHFRETPREFLEDRERAKHEAELSPIAAANPPGLEPLAYTCAAAEA